ncbi:MAG: bifunctional riboflavin kinase/FAD synthetase [Bacteroidales bacterium]|nr:bifunctional riboflavin kinase/FAD synthetase [Bacteroidales bacterium]MDD3892162.1 bifunctional riboflavin kinase/FAD synthetase [Bacteroidales bacterium]
MLVYTNINELKLTNSSVTIGFFDGLHIGHKRVLDIVKQNAKKDNAQSLVITFWPHPRIALNNDSEELRLLSSLDEKISLFEAMGLDSLLIINFTKEFAKENAYTFLQNTLVEKIKASTIVMGYNHAFGYRGEGNFNLVQKHQQNYGYQAIKVDPIEINGQKVSSTQIRLALTEGNLKLANAMLGRLYCINGTIEGGKQIGRSIGYPTANIKLLEPLKLIPRNGVYAVWVEYNNQKYPSMLNIGLRPTFGSNLNITIEAHIIGFKHNIYNEQIRVFFVERIRDEIQFPSLTSLKSQLALDKIKALTILENE